LIRFAIQVNESRTSAYIASGFAICYQAASLVTPVGGVNVETDMSVIRTVAVFAVLFSVPALGLSRSHSKQVARAHAAAKHAKATSRTHLAKKAAPRTQPTDQAEHTSPRLAEADTAPAADSRPSEEARGNDDEGSSGSRRVITHSTTSAAADDDATVR
jgi:hypothetical protein